VSLVNICATWLMQWMEDRETPRMHKYGESKTTRIMMATVRHVTSSSGLRKFQAAWFLLNRVYIANRLYYPAPPSLAVSCMSGFQTVGLKIFSLSNNALTVLNNISKWCFENWRNNCSSTSETLYHPFHPQLGVCTLRITSRQKPLSTIVIVISIHQ
jgi:hypothetical protein